MRFKDLYFFFFSWTGHSDLLNSLGKNVSIIQLKQEMERGEETAGKVPWEAVPAPFLEVPKTKLE